MCSIPFWDARASSASLRTDLGSLGCETIGTDNVVVSTVSLDEIRNRTYSVLRDVATSKLASDPSSGSKGNEPGRDLELLHLWASSLTAESREPSWFVNYYVWPEGVQRVKRLLQIMNKGIVCLVGLQGIGKTSALRALFYDHVRHHKAARPVQADSSGYSQAS